jgi:hypothetical protein
MSLDVLRTVYNCGALRKEWIDYAVVYLFNTSPKGVSISRLLSRIIPGKAGISLEKQDYKLQL